MNKITLYFRQANGLQPTIADKLLLFLLRFQANSLVIDLNSSFEPNKFTVIGNHSLLLLHHDQLVPEKLIELFGVGLVMPEGERVLDGLIFYLLPAGNENVV